MFTIIGGDGKEYGPVTVDQIRSWIAQGRANVDTRARAVGSDEFRRLGDFPEFGGPGGAPPVIVAGGAAAAMPAMATGGELAGRGARTGAALVNAFLYLLATMPGSMYVTRRMLEKNPELAKGGFPRIEELDLTAVFEGKMWIWAGIIAAIFLQSILIAVRGQNVGKMLVNARVVRADNGQPAGFVKGALARYIIPVMMVLVLNELLLVVGFLLLLVDYCFIFRDDRRCLHDLIAGTKVVKVS